MKTPFFSVIVPVYKVEQYLAKCIESILSQTFSDFELILVDDGSPDSCPDICNYYATKDNRIKVIHKPNGGLSDARNVGLSAITMNTDVKSDEGYIIFIDSDDYFCNNNTFQQLYDRISNFKEEIVLYGCKTIKDDGTEKITRGNYPFNIINQHNKTNTLNALWESNNIPGAAWIFSVKRTLVKENNLKFAKGITAEDIEWIISNIILCNNIGAIDGVHYAYIKHDNSITSKSRISGYWGLKVAMERYSQYDKHYSALDAFLIRIYLLAVMSYNDLPKKHRKEANQILEQYLTFLKNHNKKIYYYFIKLFGFKLSSNAIRFAYNKLI